MGVGPASHTLPVLIRNHVASMRRYASDLVADGDLPFDSPIVARIRSCASDLETAAERIISKEKKSG